MVFLAKLLESELTVSYEAACLGKQLDTLNGKKVLNLAGLATLIAAEVAASTPFLKFTFGKFTAPIELKLARAKEAELLRSHDVAHWCSADVDPRGPGGTLAMLPCTTCCGGEKV